MSSALFSTGSCPVTFEPINFWPPWLVLKGPPRRSFHSLFHTVMKPGAFMYLLCFCIWNMCGLNGLSVLDVSQSTSFQIWGVNPSSLLFSPLVSCSLLSDLLHCMMSSRLFAQMMSCSLIAFRCFRVFFSPPRCIPVNSTWTANCPLREICFTLRTIFPVFSVTARLWWGFWSLRDQQMLQGVTATSFKYPIGKSNDLHPSRFTARSVVPQSAMCRVREPVIYRNHSSSWR